VGESHISIVVPAWGAYAGAPLRDALNSLRGQDVAARILVVDNASAEPVSRLDGVELVRAPRRLTLGAARNLGLSHVETPYVLFWDADDLMLPGTLGFLSARIAGDPSLVAVAAGVLEDEPRVRHRWPPRWSARIARRPRLFAICHSIWSLFPSTGATLMRTHAVRESGGYAEAKRAESAEDWVLGASLAIRGRVELHERPGRVYRRLGESIWEDLHSARHQIEHASAVRRRLRDDLGLPGWVRRGAPLLAPVHAIVLLGLAPLARVVRRMARR
jgi:glycosyltransferase involved in cell wall biosynthesis